MPVRVVPLGGLGEIGLNCMVIEATAPDGARTRIVIDAGVMFPHETLFGVDLVLPDFSFLVPSEADPRPVDAVLLTHGHEDHIGALPWLMEACASGPLGEGAIPPVFTTRFTRALAFDRLGRHGIAGKVDIRVVEPRAPFAIGPVLVDFLQVTHSIVDACGIALETPEGRIVHTGDFKIDPTPPDGESFDEKGFAGYGARGVDVLFSDSTNAERAGHTRSERAIELALDEIFAKAPGRVIVAMFASHVPRMRQVAALCAKHERRLVLEGRSMIRNSGIARDLGHLKVAPGLLATIDEAAQLPNQRVAILCTGSQAEPGSALAKMSHGGHLGSMNVRPGDTVVLSSRMIPGNERSITELVNQLHRCGARVVYEAVEEIHVSGHAHRDELTKMMELTRPRNFVPIHGEYRHLVQHAELAQANGIDGERAKVIENGAILELAKGELRVTGRAPSGRFYLDAQHARGVSESLVKERQEIARWGLAVLRLGRDATGALAVAEVVTRGIAGPEDSLRLDRAAAAEAAATLASLSPSAREDAALLREEMRRAVRRAIHRERGYKPVVLVVGSS